jgi:hypothetical protein
MGDARYCPWRHLGSLEGVTLSYHDEGPMGLTRFADRRVSLRRGLSPAQRRSTLAHELAHVEAGAFIAYEPECPGVTHDLAEHVADLTAVARLIPAHVLEDLPWLVETHGHDVVCEVLGVDRGIIRTAIMACRSVR